MKTRTEKKLRYLAGISAYAISRSNNIGQKVGIKSVYRRLKRWYHSLNRFQKEAFNKS